MSRVSQTAMQPKRSPLEKLQQSWQTAFNTENRAFTLDVLKVLISAFGVLATVFAGVGLYLSYRTSQVQLESTRLEQQLNIERLVTDRFAKAVEQLGNGAIDVRIGAIYSLERTASPKDHWVIMEVLTAFVKNRSPLPEDWKSGKAWEAEKDERQKLPRVTADVKAALKAIGRRNAKLDPIGEVLELDRSNLNGASLKSADLKHAYLVMAQLQYADLRKAKLNQAELQGADLSNALLIGTDFGGANIESTNLSSVVGLNSNQVKAAQNWEKAHYDPDFRQQLGLPPEKLKP